MARVVYLHVGAPKTGTTYLQDRLLVNQASLAEHGIKYPVGLKSDMFLPALDLIERSWGGQRKKAVGQWDALLRRVRRTHGVAVISHEILAAARPEQIERALSGLAGYEVHLIYSARDLGRQIPAEWQEQIKHRAKMRFGSYLKQVREADRADPTLWFWRVQGLPSVLSRWGRSLPGEHIHLITVPQPGADPDLLWHRFCSVVGIDPAWAPLDSDRSNRSLGSAETTMLRRLNKRLGGVVNSSEYAELVRRTLAHRALSQRDGMTRATLPPKMHEWAAEVAEESIEWAKAAGIDVVGDLGELRPRFSQTTWRDPDKPRESEVADAALDALVALLAEAAGRRKPARVQERVSKAVRRLRNYP